MLKPTKLLTKKVNSFFNLENKVPRETSKKRQNKNRGRKQSSTWNIKKEAKIKIEAENKVPRETSKKRRK